MNDNYLPTVTGHRQQGDSLVLETLDFRQETDLISMEGEPLQRQGDLVSEEQAEVLGLYERN